jgi:hypothetical protein
LGDAESIARSGAGLRRPGKRREATQAGLTCVVDIAADVALMGRLCDGGVSEGFRSGYCGAALAALLACGEL